MSLRLAAVTLSLTALVLSGCSSVTDDEAALQAPVTEEVFEEGNELESDDGADSQSVDSTEPVEEEPDTAPEPAATRESEPAPAPEPTQPRAPVTKDPVEVETAESDAVESAQAPPAHDPDRYGYTPVNERGNMVKQIGQLAGIADLTQEGATTSEFTVTAIEPDFQCTSDYAEPALNGSYLAITFEVTTTPELAHSAWPEWYMSPHDLRIISADGMRENDSIGNSYSCLRAADELPRSLGPGERARGKIVLDTAHTSGYLVVVNDSLATGWEWAY